MPVYIGTSGWQYKHWRKLFYPAEVRNRQELSYYSERFQTVEVNATFYRLPEAEIFARWAEQSPRDFIFAVKASRFLTHLKRMKVPEEPVKRLMTRARSLGSKLGPVLIQLPGNFHATPDRLKRTLKAFPKGTRVAVEFRHESWFIDEVRQILGDHQAALCWTDAGSKLTCPEWKTAGWAYFRFHFGTASPPSCYSSAVLRQRAQQLRKAWRKSDDYFVYFNNDSHGCALRDAFEFGQIMQDLGLKVSRTPEFELVG